MNYHNQSKENVMTLLDTTEIGLSAEEASKRIATNGKNKLNEAAKDSNLKRFFKQLLEPMTVILIVAAAISAGVEIYNGISSGHWAFPTDVIIILAVVIINAILGVLQESKAEKAIEALQEIAAATSKVIRDGKQITVRSEDLAIGDIIVLEAGDAVPADSRIIECASIKAEESALTGESVPVNKTDEAMDNEDIPLGDRKNMVYMGSVIVYGRGKAVVCATGMDTEMGKIANALTNAKEGKTPLQIKLAQLSKILTYLVVDICIVIFGVQLVRYGVGFETVLSSFMLSISLAVAAIPEGLSTVVTIVLSIGVTNMSKQNAIIRKLTAVETLGCTQIICSDKTGTLTQNKMTVVEHYGSDEELIANAMSLCSDAEYDTSIGEAVGEPTECALVNYAEKIDKSKNTQKEKYVRIGEIPFDSMRKMMTTVHKTENGEIIQFTKGAPDEILKICTTAIVNRKEVRLTNELKNDILKANKSMADKALRVLAVASGSLPDAPSSYEPQDLENDLCFIGMVGMIDPVRPDVKLAIDKCSLAGIRPIMITGDHKDTAVAIAKELGIISEPTEAITGAELDSISENEFEKLVDKYSVYARVQPEHKTRIVNAWQKRGKVTAMTGDGVNDAPSIKNADIGIGMGITGTDVTKNVADMILADDNFATIVSAAAEGRRIYDNIRKAIQFLLASNLSEVLAIFFATLLGFTVFKPVQLLWINLITDCFPALALGMEKPEDDVMKREPRDSKEGIFAGGLGFAVIYQGILVTLITLISYFIGSFIENGALSFTADSILGSTMAFLTLAMCEVFHSFNMRSQKNSLFKMKTKNLWLIGAGALSLLLTSLVVLIEPIAAVFGMISIGFKEYFIAMVLGLTIIPLVELAKLITRRTTK